MIEYGTLGGWGGRTVAPHLVRVGTVAADNAHVVASSVAAWLRAHCAECFAARFEEEGFVCMRDASQTGILDMVQTGDFDKEDMAAIGEWRPQPGPPRGQYHSRYLDVV